MVYPGYQEGPEQSATGETAGRDPRKMTIEELQTLGHFKTPLLKIIRTKCLDCANSETEVRKCARVQSCVLWPYRMRSNPFSGRTGNPEAGKSLAEWRKRQTETEGSEDE
jgi:hypothetical protein